MQENHSNLIDLFTEIVKKYPDRVAVKDSRSCLTYFDLYNRAVSVAARLIGNGVTVGDRIACVSKKDVESIICFWGILLAGGVVVMLDQEDGIKSNEVKLKTVKPKVIILDKTTQSLSEEFLSICFDVNDFVAASSVQGSIKYISQIPGNATCYILLTSGTTGEPKAVQVSHKNVLHYTYAINDKVGRPDKVNAAHVSTFASDLGMTNFFVALISGGMLRVLNRTESTDPDNFNRIINDDFISFLKITPSHLFSLIINNRKSYVRPIDIVVLGGEKLSWETVRNVYSLNVCKHLYNHYGPTETTIGATAIKITPDSKYFDTTSSVPIGQPLGSGICFLEDAPEGVGELLIAGPGVTLGYFERESSENFIVKELNGEILRCYRTGDICKMLGDNTFEFLYRNDRQVKINGYRIELGEIEIAISVHPLVENVLVSVANNREHQRMEAFIKVIDQSGLTKETLKTWLREKLPGYKIPADLYFYKEAPYNLNGKIDLMALKKSFSSLGDVKGVDVEIENPTADPWAKFVEISWTGILNKDEVALSDKFFEIGGDSLLAIQVIGKLQRYGYKIHISDLNNNPVLRDFILLQPSRTVNDDKAIVDDQKLNQLTHSQYKFLQHWKVDEDKYCQVILLETEDRIRAREMAHAFNYVREGHLQLTRRFEGSSKFKSGNRYKRLASVGTSVLNDRVSVISQIQDECQELLNQVSIENGELFVMHLFIDTNGKDYIYFACHHLVTDVISWNIIIDELLDYYDQLIRGCAITIQSENTVCQFLNEVDPSEFDYEVVSEFNEPIYKLPKYNVTSGPEESVNVYNLLIPGEISAALKKYDEKKHAVTLTGFLLNALSEALLKEFGIDDLTLNFEFHGRPQSQHLPDLSRSVGWWALTMPLTVQRAKLSPGYCSLAIKRKTDIANRINLNRTDYPEVRDDTADVLFNYLGHFPEQYGNSSIQVKPSSFNPGATRSKKAQMEYKLAVTSRFIADSLIMDFQYQLSWFNRERMDRVIDSFFNYLKKSLSNFGHDFNSSKLISHVSNLPSCGQPLHNICFNRKRDTDNHEKTIFLTGGTGFLGCYLLNELIRENGVNVYCLVRAETQKEAEARLLSVLNFYFSDLEQCMLDKITVFNGDLLSENIGMTNSNYQTITNKADVIIHAAADINLLKDYNDLKKTNIDSTQNMIALAGTGKNKTLHYVSTLAICGYSPDRQNRRFSENDFDQGQYFISGYEKTKFEAEKLVRSFFKSGGKGKIYRVGHIAANSITGKFQQKIGQNRIFQLLRGIILLKKIPKNYLESVSFSYVDIVAKGIVNFCMEYTTSPLQCIHLENSQYLSFMEISEILKQIGYEIDLADVIVVKMSISNFEGDLREKKILDLMYNWLQRYVEHPRNISYLQKDSLDTIGRSGIYFPKADVEWFSKMIKEGVERGYFLDTSHGLPSILACKPLEFSEATLDIS